MKTIRLGVLGYGFMGRTHSWGARSLPFFYRDLPFRLELAAVASPSEESRRLARQEGGFSFVTSDWREVVDNPAIDAVTVSTPNPLHREMLVAAIERGKHIYADKPLTVTADEAEEVVRALAGRDLTHQMIFHNRFFPSAMRARELIDEGRIGEIIGFRGVYLHSGSIHPEKPMGWKQRGAAGGGVLLDLGSHLVDMARWLMGDFEAVWGVSRVLYPERPLPGGGREEVTAEDQCLLTVRLTGGAIGTLEASKIATGVDDGLKLEIHGTRGALLLDLADADSLLFFDESDPERPLGGERGFQRIRTSQRYPAPAQFPSFKNSAGWLRGHLHCLYSFADAVAAGRPATPSLHDGLAVQRILDAATRSFASGQWEKV